jgi:hypothetical protein
MGRHSRKGCSPRLRPSTGDADCIRLVPEQLHLRLQASSSGQTPAPKPPAHYPDRLRHHVSSPCGREGLDVKAHHRTSPTGTSQRTCNPCPSHNYLPDSQVTMTGTTVTFYRPFRDRINRFTDGRGMTRTKILHDGRIMGTVAACLLSRVHKRRGESVDISYDANGLHTQEFWTNVTMHFDPEQYDHLVLCGITYHEIDPTSCNATLADLAERTALTVWSHRWPDGYAYSPAIDTVLVPQYDFYTTIRHELSDAELTLFRLAQILYRDLPTAQIGAEDRLASQGLDTLFESDATEIFESLRDGDPEDLIQMLQRAGGTPDPVAATPISEVVSPHSVYPVLSFDLKPSAQGREERYINYYARGEEIENECIAVATRFFGDTERLYVTRPRSTGSLPSVEWLLREADDHRIAGLTWLGPQDARHVRLDPQLSPRDKLALRDLLVEYIKTAQGRDEGQRRPPAGLTRYMYEVATEALRGLDLLGTYTREDPTLEFLPSRTWLLLDKGNRTGSPRSTLVLHVLVSSIDGAVFLFGNEGYNFGKLERLLEGSLLGLHAGASSWVGSIELPRRVRVDVHIGDGLDMGDLPKALRVPSTRGIPVQTAFRTDTIVSTSRIGRALADLGIETLVLLSESETIGPSIPYAILASELCRQLASQRGSAADNYTRRFEVLDLFAGSGVSARVIVNEIPNANVLAVDLMIRSTDVHLADVPGITWLTADARTVIGDTGLVDRRFDLICLDPPHALLLDLVFGHHEDSQPLVTRLAMASGWLIMYIGHASQEGRIHIVDALMSSQYKNRAWFQIGQEVVLVAGPNAHGDQPFEDTIRSLMHTAEGRLDAAGWTLRRRYN